MWIVAQPTPLSRCVHTHSSGLLGINLVQDEAAKPISRFLQQFKILHFVMSLFAQHLADSQQHYPTMQSIFNRMFRREPRPNISIMGLDDAGKSTMLAPQSPQHVLPSG